MNGTTGAIVQESAAVAPAFDAVDAPSLDLMSACVHCGFCLPTCPTYRLWGEEMDSPRGRIYLMKEAAEGRTPMSSTFVGHFDTCLGCMACVTACPSGVQYGPLIERTRAQIERRYERPLRERLLRRALFSVLPYPARLRALLAPLLIVGPAVRAAGASRVAQRLPAFFRSIMALAPRITWAGVADGLPAEARAAGTRRLTVGLLAGCVQRVAFPHVHAATVRVLAAEGCDVRVPHGQGCCGALALHAGRLDEGRAFARRLIAAFEHAEVDRIVVNAAGCGSAMKEYGDLLADDPDWAARARAFSARVRDISELLVELGEPRARRHPIHARVTYHDACHLAHAQGIRSAPRDLLRAIPGIELVTPADAEICCGSAGIYNLVQPEPAAALGAEKAARLAETKPDIVATANPGCTLQIAAAGRRRGEQWPVVHPIEIVDASIRGESVINVVAGLQPAR
jgi:glycolate oxidase iron-sulfur subunit